MIRNAEASDSEFIAKELWRIWCQFRVRQIGSPIRGYASSEALRAEICDGLAHWLVCEPSDSKPAGFFSFKAIGEDRIYKRCGFPGKTISIEHFSCLMTGEEIARDLGLLAAHMPQESISLTIPSSLRDAYWAALKAGFRHLGDIPLVVGEQVWLFLDREAKGDVIKTKLRRIRWIAK